MFDAMTTLNIVRLGNVMTFSSMQSIGRTILDSFPGIIEEFRLAHQDSPTMDSIDAYFLTMVLNSEIGGHILGITDADLKIDDENDFYSSIIGGKNPKKHVAVVSTRRLSPKTIETDRDYWMLISRTLKVALHEIGHNLGLTDHGSYTYASDGSLCPMSEGETNRFGFRGYVRAVVDGRGFMFCSECCGFLRAVYGTGC